MKQTPDAFRATLRTLRGAAEKAGGISLEQAAAAYEFIADANATERSPPDVREQAKSQIRHIFDEFVATADEDESLYDRHDRVELMQRVGLNPKLRADRAFADHQVRRLRLEHKPNGESPPDDTPVGVVAAARRARKAVE